MQKWTPNVAGIIEHAKEIHPKTEVISRLVSGEVHRTNYEEVCIRSRKLASALEKDGVKHGDVIATLALNTFRHLEMYYGISGMGAVTCLLYTSDAADYKMGVDLGGRRIIKKIF